jgi:hypothetical protein
MLIGFAEGKVAVDVIPWDGAGSMVKVTVDKDYEHAREVVSALRRKRFETRPPEDEKHLLFSKVVIGLNAVKYATKTCVELLEETRKGE